MKTAYQLTRDVYLRVFDARPLQARKARRAFYGQFVGRGDVAFDIGANRGHVSEALIELGARVVAVEPNPSLAPLLRRRYGRQLTVIQAAVGDADGERILYLGQNDLHWTVSDAWRDRAPRGHVWTEAIKVPLITLDQLIDTHGNPDFVKIDVEGYEPKVLAGLSTPVSVLSFEFQGPALDFAHECLDRLEELADYRFAHTVREEATLVTGFATRAELWARLTELRERDPLAYGDVLATCLDQKSRSIEGV